MINDTISQRVKDLLNRSGLKQTHIAAKLGIAPQQLNRFLKSNVRDTKYLANLAKLFNVSETWLRTGVSDNNSQLAQVLQVDDILSLMDASISLSELMKIMLYAIPVAIKPKGYIFALQTQGNFQADNIIKKDYLVFSTFLPSTRTELCNKIVVCYLDKLKSVKLGKILVDKNHKQLLLINDETACCLKQKDKIIGVCKQVIRLVEEEK